jgi:hypothetical protein
MADYACRQRSGFPPEVDQVSATTFDRCLGVAKEMGFLSPVLPFRCNPINIQVAAFTDT